MPTKREVFEQHIFHADVSFKSVDGQKVFRVPAPTGVDDFANIEGAIIACNALANGGIVELASGTYITAGGHTALNQKARIVGKGVTSTTISHTGNNSCFTLNAPGVTSERVGVESILITGNSSASACGIEIRDVNFGAYLTHVRIIGYTGNSSSGAVLLNNFASNQFTEGVQFDDVSISNCLNGIIFHRTSGTDSFNATHMKNVAINVPNNGVGIGVGTLAGSGVCTVYNAEWHVQLWFDNHTSNFGLDIGASSRVWQIFIWFHGEGLTGSSKVVRVQAGSTLAYWGSFQFGKDATWTTTGAAYHMLWDPNNVGNMATQVGVAVAPQGAVSGIPVLGVSPYNATNSQLPATTAGQYAGIDKDGNIVQLSFQSNVKIQVKSGGNNSSALLYTDPNSVVYNVVKKSQALTFPGAGGAVATDFTFGGPFKITVTDGIAFTISNPTGAASGDRILYDILNSSGGAMGAITWGTNFALAGAFTNPASTKRRTIEFYFNSADTKWVEIARAGADI